MGPMSPISVNGKLYVAGYVDHRSRYAWTKSITAKSEQPMIFKQLVVHNKIQNNVVVRGIRSDNGDEYLSNEMKQFCLLNGIIQQTMHSYSPHENGIAERWNRTLTEMVRCLLVQSGLSIVYWDEMVNTATYIRNRCVVGTIRKTPFEAFYHTKPKIEHMRTIGCLVYYKVKKNLKENLDHEVRERYCWDIAR